jgi:hypothetical protein
MNDSAEGTGVSSTMGLFSHGIVEQINLYFTIRMSHVLVWEEFTSLGISKLGHWVNWFWDARYVCDVTFWDLQSVIWWCDVKNVMTWRHFTGFHKLEYLETLINFTILLEMRSHLLLSFRFSLDGNSVTFPQTPLQNYSAMNCQSNIVKHWYTSHLDTKFVQISLFLFDSIWIVIRWIFPGTTVQNYSAMNCWVDCDFLQKLCHESPSWSQSME